MKDVRGYEGNCVIPMEEFIVTHEVLARYVKFVPKSYYGVISGLQYIGWKTVDN